jgi:hypothetical protein
MRGLKWQYSLGVFLILASILIYIIHYTIFRDSRYLFRILGAQLAFLPISVLLVTVILNQLLSKIKKRDTLGKLNMIIGAFFSEVGTELIGRFSGFDLLFDKIRSHLAVSSHWSKNDFTEAKKRIEALDVQIDSKAGDLKDLRRLLVRKRGFFLRLLENPNLLEHGSFTDLLWAVFHLTEELEHRKDLSRIGDADHAHLSVDIKRAYVLLISQWADYMNHLKDNYPYLFSLAVRMNPFDPNASPEITA